MRWVIAAAASVLVLLPGAAAQAAEPACSLAAPAGQTVGVPVGSRTVLLHVPKGYDGRTRVPLVLDLHGTYDNKEGQLTSSGSEAAGDRHGYAIAAADGGLKGRIGFNGQGYLWNLPGTLQFGEQRPAGAPDDIDFLGALLDAVSTRICVDHLRVFSMGYSNGGRVSSYLACELGQRIAAIAPVAGVRAGYPTQDAAGEDVPDPRTCRPQRPVSVVIFHGTADPIAPYAGGGQESWGYSVETARRAWERIDGCTKVATEQVSASVRRVASTGCAQGTEVTAYIVSGGGHTWPGSERVTPFGTTTQDIDATEIAFDTFARHPLPELPPAQLSAQVSRLRAGARVRATLTLTAARGDGRPDPVQAAVIRERPLAGARVLLGGRVATTDAQGRATMTFRVSRTARRLTAKATREGYAPARLTLRVTRR